MSKRKPGEVAATGARVASALGYLLRRAKIVSAQLSNEVVAGAGWSEPEGASLRELSVLLVVSHFGPLSQQQAADRLAINRSVMVRLVDGLEARKELERARDLSDRRRYSLQTTEAGARRGRELVATLRRTDERFSGRLGPAGRERLVTSLAELVSRPGEELPPELVVSPSFLCHAAQQRLEHLGDERLAPLGLSVRSFVALAVLAGAECSQRDLASHMLIGPAATVDLVDELERLGAVLRVADPLDRRVHRLELTPAGEALHGRARAVVSRATDEFTRPLGPARSEELVRLLAVVSSPELPHVDTE